MGVALGSGRAASEQQAELRRFEVRCWLVTWHLPLLSHGFRSTVTQKINNHRASHLKAPTNNDFFLGTTGLQANGMEMTRCVHIVTLPGCPSLGLSRPVGSLPSSPIVSHLSPPLHRRYLSIGSFLHRPPPHARLHASHQYLPSDPPVIGCEQGSQFP